MTNGNKPSELPEVSLLDFSVSLGLFVAEKATDKEIRKYVKRVANRLPKEYRYLALYFTDPKVKPRKLAREFLAKLER